MDFLQKLWRGSSEKKSIGHELLFHPELETNFSLSFDANRELLENTFAKCSDVVLMELRQAEKVKLFSGFFRLFFMESGHNRKEKKTFR